VGPRASVQVRDLASSRLFPDHAAFLHFVSSHHTSHPPPPPPIPCCQVRLGLRQVLAALSPGELVVARGGASTGLTTLLRGGAPGAAWNQLAGVAAASDPAAAAKVGHRRGGQGRVKLELAGTGCHLVVSAMQAA
jgi:hypothetical protein